MWDEILVGVACFLIGIGIGFFVTKTMMKKYIEQNTVINEQMIVSMMKQMGQKPTQKKVNQIVNVLEKEKNKKK